MSTLPPAGPGPAAAAGQPSLGPPVRPARLSPLAIASLCLATGAVACAVVAVLASALIPRYPDDPSILPETSVWAGIEGYVLFAAWLVVAVGCLLLATGAGIVGAVIDLLLLVRLIRVHPRVPERARAAWIAALVVLPLGLLVHLAGTEVPTLVLSGSEDRGLPVLLTVAAGFTLGVGARIGLLVLCRHLERWMIGPAAAAAPHL